MKTRFTLLVLSIAVLGGCMSVSTPPNRSSADPSSPSAPEASSRRARPNLVATTQVYLDPSVGQGAQKMEHGNMQGMAGMESMQGMDHSKMPGMGTQPQPSPTAGQPSDAMQGMDHSKMEGTAKQGPANKEVIEAEMKKTSDEMKKVSDELKEKSDEMKAEEKSGEPKPAASPTSVYTCPMHPEVRQPNPGTCPKCGMTLVKGKPSAQ